MSQPPYPPPAPQGRPHYPPSSPQPRHGQQQYPPPRHGHVPTAATGQRYAGPPAQRPPAPQPAAPRQPAAQEPEQPAPQRPAPRRAEPSAPRNGLGLAALIVGLVGILFGLVPFTGFIAVICALVAIPLALTGWSRVRKGAATNRNTTISGLIVGVGALALGIWGITIVFGAMEQLADDLSGPAPVGTPAVPGQQPAAEAPLGTPPPVTTAGFGERITFEDGIAVEVSQPESYRPGRYAIGHDAARAVMVKVTIYNDSPKGVEIIGAQVNAVHGGQQVSKIFDGSSNGTENPQGTVLPGKSSTFNVALSLPQDAADLQIEVAPSFMYDPAIFTGQV